MAINQQNQQVGGEFTPKANEDQSATQRLRGSSGYLIEEANTPAGAARSGAEPDESKMFGTPAQQQAQPRQDTLESRERYEKPGAAGPTDAQQQAKQAAEDLSKLGPVKTAVQARIQEQFAAQGDIAETVDTEQLSQIATDNNWSAEGKANVQFALEQYQANPTDELYQSLQDAISTANGERGSYALGRENVGDLFTVDYGLDLSGQNQMGLLVSPEEASALNNVPGMEGWENLTLSEFEARLDQIEAQQFQEAESLRAQLADPSLPPALRQQLLSQYAQLSAAGITGAEEAIDRLDEQINLGAELSVGGVPMKLEDILSDDSLSQLIANAVKDPEYLEKLDEDLNYADLGKWIRENQEDLFELIGELETQIISYDQVQTALKNEFDKYDEADIPAILGFLGLDKIPERMTGTEWEALLGTIKNSTAYNYLKNNYEKMVEGDVDNLVKMEQNGYTETEIETAFEYAQDLQADPLLAELMGDLDIFSSKEAMGQVGRYSEMLDEIGDGGRGALTELLDTGITLDEDDLEFLANHPSPETFISEWATSEANKKKFRDLVNNLSGYSASELTPKDQSDLKQALGIAGDYTSFGHSFRFSDAETKRQLLDIFDTSGDGKIDENEFNNIDPSRIGNVIDLNPAEDFTQRPGDVSYLDELAAGAAGYANWVKTSGHDVVSAMENVPPEILAALERGESLQSAIWNTDKRLTSDQYARLAEVAGNDPSRGWNKDQLLAYANHQGRDEMFATVGGQDVWDFITQGWNDPTTLNEQSRNRMHDLAAMIAPMLDDAERSPYERAWLSHAYHRAMQARNAYDTQAQQAAEAAAAAEVERKEWHGLQTVTGISSTELQRVIGLAERNAPAAINEMSKIETIIGELIKANKNTGINERQMGQLNMLTDWMKKQKGANWMHPESYGQGANTQNLISGAIQQLGADKPLIDGVEWWDGSAATYDSEATAASKSGIFNKAIAVRNPFTNKVTYRPATMKDFQ